MYGMSSRSQFQAELTRDDEGGIGAERGELWAGKPATDKNHQRVWTCAQLFSV